MAGRAAGGGPQQLLHAREKQFSKDMKFLFADRRRTFSNWYQVWCLLHDHFEVNHPNGRTMMAFARVLQAINTSSGQNIEYTMTRADDWIFYTNSIRDQAVAQGFHHLQNNHDAVRAELNVNRGDAGVWTQIINNLKVANGNRAGATNPIEYGQKMRDHFDNWLDTGIWGGPSVHDKIPNIISGIKAAVDNNLFYGAAHDEDALASFLNHANARRWPDHDAATRNILFGILLNLPNYINRQVDGAGGGISNLWSCDYLACLHIACHRANIPPIAIAGEFQAIAALFEGSVGQASAKTRMATGSALIRALVPVISQNANRYQHPGNLTIHRLRTISCQAHPETDAVENVAFGNTHEIAEAWERQEALRLDAVNAGQRNAQNINTVENIAHRLLQGEADITRDRKNKIGSAMNCRIVSNP